MCCSAFGGPASALVGVFTPWELLSAPKSGSLSGELVVKHLQTHHGCRALRVETSAWALWGTEEDGRPWGGRKGFSDQVAPWRVRPT